MISQCKTHLKFIFTILLCSLVGGCASFGPTIPNAPYQGPYPEPFNMLAQKNPLLGKEFAKIPEFQDGISDAEATALEKIAAIYIDDPEAFNMAFDQMNQVGIPKVRKYCSPLQALFWLAEDGKLDDAKDILKDYSLGKWLRTAWDFQPKPIPFSEEQISMIIDNMKDKSLQEQFFRYKNDKKHIQRLISFTYKHQPRIFKRKARAIIKEVKSKNENMRWKDFDIVTDRLNSPELLDYYERFVISYMYLPNYGEGSEEARRVFKNKYGHCAQVTAFTVYILQKSGYESRRYIVANPALKSPKGNYHRATLFIVKGKKYIMDNGRTPPMGIVRFEDYGSSTSRKKDARLQGEPMIYTR